MRILNLIYFESMIKHAEKVQECISVLADYCTLPSEETLKTAVNKKHEKDQLLNKVKEEISHTLIVQEEAEKLICFSIALDNLAENALDALDTMDIYETEPNQHLSELSQRLRDVSCIFLSCVKIFVKNEIVSDDEIQNLKNTINFLNQDFRRSISELFREVDTRHILRFHEIYRHIRLASDSAELCLERMEDLLLPVHRQRKYGFSLMV